MCYATIDKLILADDIESALSLAQKVLGDNKNVSKVAANILGVLATFLSKLTRCKTSSKSHPELIFKLADECCRSISLDWNYNRTKFMQFVYHICEYLINNESELYAKKLVVYIIKLKEETRNKHVKVYSWDFDQKNVLANLVRSFANALFFNSKKSRPFSADEDSIQSWWNFLMSLSELNNYDYFNLTFQFTSLTFSKLADFDNVINFGELVFNRFYSVLNENNAIILIDNQKDFSTVIFMFASYISKIPYNKFENLDFRNLLKALKTISSSIKKQDFVYQLQFIINLISLVHECDKDKFSSFLEQLSCDLKHLSSIKYKDSLQFLSTLIFKVFKTLSKKNDIIANHGESLFKLLMDIQPIIKKNLLSIKLPEKNYTSILNNVVCATLYIALSLISDKEKHKFIFNHLWTTLHVLFKQSSFTEEGSINELNVSVDICKKIIISFQNVGVDWHAKELCRLLLVFLNDVHLSSPDLKENVSQILNHFVVTSSKSRFSYECLTFILALATSDNPLFKCEDKFKYWCKLKLLPNTGVENVTVYDIINRDNDRQLDETVVDEVTKWPFSTVSGLDSSDLLLDEIRAYVKHGELLKKSVLAVYRVAVTSLKPNITLAQILCCATEVCSISLDLSANINKFQLSLKNMVKIFSVEKSDMPNTARLFILGDLHYYLARCEISYLRNLAKTLVVELQPESVPIPSFIPVVEDPLDCSIISSAHAFIAYSTQNKFLSLLKQAHDFWTRAVTTAKGDKNDMDSLNKIAVSSMYYIKTSGYLYRLLKNIKCETMMWNLLLEAADFFNHSKYKIIAFSELLCSTLKLDSSAVDKMHSFVTSDTYTKDKYYYYLFLINLSKNKIFNKQFEESKEIFNLIDVSKIKTFPLIQLQYAVLSYWLKCAMGNSDKSKSRLLIDQFERSLSFQLHNKFCNFAEQTINHVLLLDLSLVVSRMFYHCKDVRLSRFYSSYCLTLSQKLHLPTTACEFLILQAFIDLLCINPDEALNKLNSIETILELTHKKPGYEVHIESCNCPPCSHLEHNITQVYAMLVKAGFYKLQNNSNNFITIIKASQELIVRIKKKLTGNFISELYDCDIFFCRMALDALTGWRKHDKALKYLDHAMKSINKCYRPSDADLSSECLANLLKLKFNLKLTPSNVTELYIEDSSDDVLTTPETRHELVTPPPFHYKVHSPAVNGLTPLPVIPMKCKLDFEKDIISKCDEENCNKEESKLKKENIIKNIEKIQVTKTPLSISKKIPIIISECAQNMPSKASKGIQKTPRTNSKFLKVPNERTVASLMKKTALTNFTTPKNKTAPISVFVDEFSDHQQQSSVEQSNKNSRHVKGKTKENTSSAKIQRKLFCKSNDKNESDIDNSDSLPENNTTSSLYDSSSSIIEATIIENSDSEDNNSHLPKTALKVETLASSFSNLNVETNTPTALPLISTVKKKKIVKSKLFDTEPKNDLGTHNLESGMDQCGTSVAQSDSTPKVSRITRSSKKLLPTKKYRI